MIYARCKKCGADVPPAVLDHSDWASAWKSASQLSVENLEWVCVQRLTLSQGWERPLRSKP